MVGTVNLRCRSYAFLRAVRKPPRLRLRGLTCPFLPRESSLLPLRSTREFTTRKELCLHTGINKVEWLPPYFFSISPIPFPVGSSRYARKKVSNSIFSLTIIAPLAFAFSMAVSMQSTQSGCGFPEDSHSVLLQFHHLCWFHQY